MKRVRVGLLKDALSALLRAVERGAEVEVTDDGRPIARIVPVWGRTVGVRIVPAVRPFPSVRGRRYRGARWAVDSAALLHEERRDR